MLKTVVDVTVPVLVFLVMTVAGLELTPIDFRRVAGQLRTVALATAAQVVLWPLVAIALITALQLKPYLAAGILLVAVCPCGGMATFYTYLARGSVALAVSLTAVSCLVAVLTMPLLLTLLGRFLEDPDVVEVPVPQMIGQLVLMLIVPIVLGMMLRHWRPALAQRQGLLLLRLSIVALVALLVLVIAQEGQRVVADFLEISLSVSLLIVIMLTAGWAAGWACALGAKDRFALAMTFVVRNVGIATAVAVTILGRMEFAVFATAYFLNQVPIVVAAVVVFRLTHRNAEWSASCRQGQYGTGAQG
jgi:BASS family bile acid:Na+ symporter